ncbi:hypothetical protein C8J56DRAFT_1041065 [Mycena floridula]|nr:hypothetical protein C8J56DRAFT_1041065 [Mycena floridula]
MPDPFFSFRGRSLSLINSYALASAFGSTSTCSQSGLGSDLGRLLHWFGTKVCNGLIRVAIRHRLHGISKTFKRRSTRKMTRKRIEEFRLMCADLLELCRPDHSCKIRRKSLILILTLLYPVDGYSVLLLESDFVEMLTIVTDDCASPDEDYEMDYDLEDLGQTVMECIHLTNGFRSLHCHCPVCIKKYNLGIPCHECQGDCGAEPQSLAAVKPPLPYRVWKGVRDRCLWVGGKQYLP